MGYDMYLWGFSVSRHSVTSLRPVQSFFVPSCDEKHGGKKYEFVKRSKGRLASVLHFYSGIGYPCVNSFLHTHTHTYVVLVGRETIVVSVPNKNKVNATGSICRLTYTTTFPFKEVPATIAERESITTTTTTATKKIQRKQRIKKRQTEV